jgi:hypothetical protein
LTKTGKYKKAAAPFKQTQLLKLQLLKRLFAIFKRNKKKAVLCVKELRSL